MLIPALPPHDVVLNLRIIEIEWAWNNGKPFQPSPKKPRRRLGKRSRGASSRAPNPAEARSQRPSDNVEEQVGCPRDNFVVESPLKNQKRRLDRIDESICATPQKRKRVADDG